MKIRNIEIVKGTERENRYKDTTIPYPIVTIDNLYVERWKEPIDGPKNGVYIPNWLYELTGLIYGEKIHVNTTLIGNEGAKRTVSPVFPWDNNCAAAVGPVGEYLGDDGLINVTAYGLGSVINNPSIFVRFPDKNELNEPTFIRLSDETDSDNSKGIKIHSYIGGGIGFGEPHNEVYRRLKNEERMVLLASISGLVVDEVGPRDLDQTPTLIPHRVISSTNSLTRYMMAEIYNVDMNGPAVETHIGSSTNTKVKMLGHLANEFPPGTNFHVDIYGMIKGKKVRDDEVRPTLVDVYMRDLEE